MECFVSGSWLGEGLSLAEQESFALVLVTMWTPYPLCSEQKPLLLAVVILLQLSHSQLPKEPRRENGFISNRSNRIGSALALTQEDGKFPCARLVNGTTFSRLIQTPAGVLDWCSSSTMTAEVPRLFARRAESGECFSKHMILTFSSAISHLITVGDCCSKEPFKCLLSLLSRLLKKIIACFWCSGVWNKPSL